MSSEQQKKRIVNNESNKVIKYVKQINLFKELSNLIRASRGRSQRTSEVKTHVVRFVFLLRVNLLLREADGGHAGVMTLVLWLLCQKKSACALSLREESGKSGICKGHKNI